MGQGIKDFGTLFKNLRAKHSQTLTDASKMLGVSKTYMSLVESGKRKVPDEWVDIISKYYKLSQTEKDDLIAAKKYSNLEFEKIDVSVIINYIKNNPYTLDDLSVDLKKDFKSEKEFIECIKSYINSMIGK